MDSIKVNSLMNSTASEANPKHLSSSKTESTKDSGAKSKAVRPDSDKHEDSAVRESSANSKTNSNKDKDDYLSDLIKKSDDGDTLQISPKGNQDLSDGFVVRIKITKDKSNENEDLSESDDDFNALETFETTLTSYKGISDEKLTQMYLKGIISQYDYQKEMDYRNEHGKQMRESSAATSRTFTALVSNSSDIAETAGMIKSAYGGDAKDSKVSTEFIKAMDSLGKEKSTDDGSLLNLDIS